MANSRDEAVRVELPLPPREVSPNARGHWAKKNRAVRKYRETACVLAMRALWGYSPEWHRATMQATFYWPDKRRRDRDNAEASLKPARDGLVDAGVLSDDDELVTLPTRFEVDRENPRVELEIRQRPDLDG